MVEKSFKWKYSSIVYEVMEELKPDALLVLGDTNSCLSAISAKHRKLGGYRTLISSLINYAYKNGKSFTASTQFDNYIVQGTWNSLGMKPYFSFYNFHFDNR